MGRGWKRGGLRAAAAFLFVLHLAEGCSVRRSGRDDAAHPASAAPTVIGGDRDRARLADLAAARVGRDGDGYRIGPDDLIEIRIPDLLEVQGAAGAARSGPGGHEVPSVAGAPVFQQGIRVNADGEVSVPVLGAVRASGRTPTELEDDIGRRLVEGDILRAPQVSVLVIEYRSRVVAVTGSVERPGLYPLTRPGATLGDLVWAAGGPSKDAGRLVQFVPAAEDGGRDREPILVDLEVLLQLTGEGHGRLDPPAWPGDALTVAPAGSVLVEGWVERPGSYPVTRALTVAGAVAAAGGRAFPADGHQVKVTRNVGRAEGRSFVVDLEAVASGVAADVPVLDGDVVRLPAAPLRLIPYGAWILAKSMVHVGGSVPLF